MAVFGKRWTKEELNTLTTTDDINQLAALLPGRTLGAIRKKKMEIITFSPDPWTEDELLKFPTDRLVNTRILYELAEKLPNRSRDQIWRKMKSHGYIWDKDFVQEATEDNPYPDHGKKWTVEELALFPLDKNVDEKILKEVQALFPRRKPSSIWPKMKKEGYIWVKTEDEEATEQKESVLLSNEDKFAISLAYEIGFRFPERNVISMEPYLSKPENRRDEIASKFNLDENFTQGELYYAIGTRITPFPWEMEPIPEIATAYKTRNPKEILAAAKALHAKLEEYLNG